MTHASRGTVRWPSLFEDEVSHLGFEIPVDHRERGQVKRGVRTHQHPDPPCDCEDRSEHKPDDRRLLDGCWHARKT